MVFVFPGKCLLMKHVTACEMEQLIYKTIVVALLAAFALILSKKWGLVEYIQVHGNDFFNKLANCNFCLSFWTGCIIATLFVFITGDLSFVFVPVCSTPITRLLL